MEIFASLQMDLSSVSLCSFSRRVGSAFCCLSLRLEDLMSFMSPQIINPWSIWLMSSYIHGVVDNVRFSNYLLILFLDLLLLFFLKWQDLFFLKKQNGKISISHSTLIRQTKLNIHEVLENIIITNRVSYPNPFSYSFLLF